MGKNLWLNCVLNGELLMHATERKTADMYRKKPSRQHYDAAAAISLRLEKESNLVVGNLTGSYSCSLHCLVYSSNTSRKSSQPLSGIRMELRKFHFTDGDVSALRIFLAREEKVFVLDPHMPGLRGIWGRIGFAVIILFDQLLQMIVELLHSIGGNEDLKARIAARESLRDFEEPSSSVFL